MTIKSICAATILICTAGAACAENPASVTTPALVGPVALHENHTATHPDKGIGYWYSAKGEVCVYWGAETECMAEPVGNQLAAQPEQPVLITAHSG